MPRSWLDSGWIDLSVYVLMAYFCSRVISSACSNYARCGFLCLLVCAARVEARPIYSAACSGVSVIRSVCPIGAEDSVGAVGRNR